jgi:hypothetical protein
VARGSWLATPPISKSCTRDGFVFAALSMIAKPLWHVQVGPDGRSALSYLQKMSRYPDSFFVARPPAPSYSQYPTVARAMVASWQPSAFL